MKIAVRSVPEPVDWLWGSRLRCHPPSLDIGLTLDLFDPRVFPFFLVILLHPPVFILLFSPSTLSSSLPYLRPSTPTFIHSFIHHIHSTGSSLLPVTFFWKLSLPLKLLLCAQSSVKPSISPNQFASSTSLKCIIRTFNCYMIDLDRSSSLAALMTVVVYPYNVIHLQAGIDSLRLNLLESSTNVGTRTDCDSNKLPQHSEARHLRSITTRRTSSLEVLDRLRANPSTQHLTNTNRIDFER